MFNDTEKTIIYLDPDTLSYMYLDYSEVRSYPVMKKLYSTLHNGFVNNYLVTPLSIDSIMYFIKDNRIDLKFLNMMGGLGQVQFLQSSTIKTLQLIRVVNSFYNNTYKKPVWRDAFSGNPDEKFIHEFGKYSSLSPKNILLALEREKKNSQIFEFIDGYQTGKLIKEIARNHFSYLWEKFPDLITPYLPKIGSSETYMKEFLEYDDIKEIPQFHILSSVLYPLFDSYGIYNVESGIKDNELIAAEIMSVYLPYCHFYVTTVDIAEQVSKSRFNDLYNVKIYDHNESSLYKFIHDITELCSIKEKLSRSSAKGQSMFWKGPSLF